MNEAFRLLINDPSVPLIAVHKAKYFADKDEKLSMGPGGFVQGNETSCIQGSEQSDANLSSQHLNMPLVKQQQ